MRPHVSDELRGTTLYFDCASGIAGDMTVGALVDLGVPEEVVREALGRLPVKGYRLEFERVMRGGLSGTKFRVILDGGHERAHEHEHEHERAPHEHGHEHEHQVHEHEHEHEHGGSAAHAHAHAHADVHAADHSHGHDGGHDHGYGVGGHSRESEHRHVHYADIRAMLVASTLDDGVRGRALAMFDAIAAVEARLHGVTVESVAFHEVGAVDSIVDIVGSAAALDWLRPARVVARRVPLGRGTVMTAHGRLPIPAPATLELLRGAPVEDGGIDGELTTPTGAAILHAAVSAWGWIPSLEVVGVGWGAGDMELADRPNLLRVVAGREATALASDTCVVVEANVDDMTPELAAPLIEALMAAGARDAWLQPILMKKGRPGFLVGAIVDEAARAAVERALLRESSSIGLRRHTVERSVLPRRIVEVDTPFGRIPLKVAGEGPEANAAPEFEACRRIAAERGVPLKRVYAEAVAAFYRK